MIIAIDFDNTLAYTEYPVIIKPVKAMITYCLEMKSEGHTLILNTCRCGSFLDDAVKFCKSYGLEFDYVNKNSEGRIAKFGGDSRKISADLYIDDKAVHPIDMYSSEEKQKLWIDLIKKGT